MSRRIAPWLVAAAAFLVVLSLVLIFSWVVASDIQDHDTKVIISLVIGFVGGVPAALAAMLAKSWAEER